MTRRSTSSHNIYQIRIALEHVERPIWRRVLVSSGITLSALHEVIQLSMGWTDCHLHMFEKDGQLYGPPDPDEAMPMKSERTKLSTVLHSNKDWLRYEYDFGDGWSHKIELEKIEPVDSATRLPVCVEGTGACPPEDCGGPWGYADLLEILQDPNHEEYAETSTWLGDFSPDQFDVEIVNRRLKQYFS